MGFLVERSVGGGARTGRSMVSEKACVLLVGIDFILFFFFSSLSHRLIKMLNFFVLMSCCFV